MSWLKNAVSKAVEVGNKNNITRTVKNYADSVVQQAGQAVAEGAKLFQDRIVSNSFFLFFLIPLFVWFLNVLLISFNIK